MSEANPLHISCDKSYLLWCLPKKHAQVSPLNVVRAGHVSFHAVRHTAEEAASARSSPNPQRPSKVQRHCTERLGVAATPSPAAAPAAPPLLPTAAALLLDEIIIPLLFT